MPTTETKRPTHKIKNNGVHDYVEHGQLMAFDTLRDGVWCCVNRRTLGFLATGEGPFGALAAGGKAMKKAL